MSKTMHQTTDVHHRLLSGPLAGYNEDIKDDSRSYPTRIQKLFTMNHSQHRLFHRTKSSSIIVPNLTSNLIEEYPNARQVQIRLVFIHIGEIDTLNEKYQADIYYEARWREKRMCLNTLNLTSQQQVQFHENLIVKMTELNRSIHWSPQLFIENAIAQSGDQDKWFTIKKVNSELTQPSSPLYVNIDICEHRRMKGIFWEKLELNHFPADVQDLTISITSHHPIENCILIQDKKFHSFINREAFADQQEWSLYEHVATEERKTQEEYSFENNQSGVEQTNHSVLAMTCRAARRPGYYYWNGFCLIFLITLCSFCIFSIPPNLPQNRLQITCTLLLTSITFRWVVNRTLPQISYLTTLDIYAIISIIMLVILCIWHSIIAGVIFYSMPAIDREDIESTVIYVTIDRYVFVGLFIGFIIMNVILLVWLIRVPYKRRRDMERLDREYEAKRRALSSSSSPNQSQQDILFRRSSSVFEPISNMKISRTLRPSDGVTMIPNGSTFIPIQEVSNEMSRKNTMDIIELQKKDNPC